MSLPPSYLKRKTSDPISPPPLKRKAQSNISKNAVASFFTPASQKPKERTTWSERSPNDNTPATLLVGRYEPEKTDDSDRQERRKIAAFDLDSTLIATKSGKQFGNDATDWKWWDSSVPMKLQELYRECGFRVVILSNQAGITIHPDPKSKLPKSLTDRVSVFKQKCNAVLSQLDFTTSVYAATGKDIYRKPRTGMWQELCDDYDIPKDYVDLENSIFVGDAGGRTAQLKNKNGESGGAATVAKDFSCSDRNFAHNVGVKYQTPEEFFLGENSRDFSRDFDLELHPYVEQEGDNGIVFEKSNEQDIVLFCGPPGAGKSTFYWKHLKPLGYERVNQDTLKTRAKCFKAAGDLLSDGSSVAVDNTNPDTVGRSEWIDFANKYEVPIRCVWLKTPLELCEHNDVVRALNKPMNPEARAALPKLAFNGFASRFKEPKVNEGFQDIVEVEFKFRGTKEEYAIWGRYWT